MPNRAEKDRVMKRTDLDTVALGKVLKSPELKAAVAALAVGEHEVDAWFHLTGSVKRGADFDQNQVQKARPWLLAAALMNEIAKLAGPVKVAETLRLALASGEELEAAAKTLKKEADAAMVILGGSTLTRCNGKVTTDLTVEVIEPQTADA